MSRLRLLLFSLAPAIALTTAAPPSGFALDPCLHRSDCCVDPDMCVITDIQTLSSLMVDDMVPSLYRLATYVHGGNGVVGVSPADYPANSCGLSYTTVAMTPAAAIAAPDHYWIQSEFHPKVVDFTTPVNEVLVFVSIDHEPYPYEGLESTIWGSNSASTSDFPEGWTKGTLTTIYAKGWEEPAACALEDNSDDMTRLYVFPDGQEFRYVATQARYSLTLFEDPDHDSWPDTFDRSPLPGWQSFDDEIDAIGTPEDCNLTDVVASTVTTAQTGFIGDEFCFDGSTSTAVHGIASIGWDFQGDGDIDAPVPTACFTCEKEMTTSAQLFVTDVHGCSASTSVSVQCTDPIEHFTFYKVRTTKGTDKLMPFGPVHLDDVFGSTDFEVRRSTEFGLPSDINGGGLFDPETHLAEYKIRASKGQPKFEQLWDVRVRNQCTDNYVRLAKPTSFLVPTSEDPDDMPAPPPGGANELDNYVCYKSKVQRKMADGTPLPKFTKGIQIDVTDAFQTRRYDLKSITKVCTPASVSGSPALLAGPNKGEPISIGATTVNHPTRHLVCYKAKRAKRYIEQDGCGPLVPKSRGDKLDPKQNKHDPQLGFFVANPFVEGQLDTRKEFEVCIPSELETAAP